VRIALYELSRHSGVVKNRPARHFRRTVFLCALALLGATAAHAQEKPRGLVENNGVTRFNGFRIEQNTERDALSRGRVLDQPRRAEAVIPTQRGAKQRVIVDMTMRYRPPENTLRYLPAPGPVPVPVPVPVPR